MRSAQASHSTRPGRRIGMSYGPGAPTRMLAEHIDVAGMKRILRSEEVLSTRQHIDGTCVHGRDP